MNWPEHFGPKHQLWMKYPPSKRNQWLMEHGHIFPDPVMPSPNPVTSAPKTPLEVQQEKKDADEQIIIPQNFNHSHPDWRIPSKRNRFLSELKRVDRRNAKQLMMRKFGHPGERVPYDEFQSA